MTTRIIALVALAALIGAAAGPVAAQSVTLDFGQEGQGLATRTAQLLLLITVIGLVPGLAVTVTCFPFIVTVLSILRQAIGLQQSPPNMMIVALALFLTWYVMEPVFLQAWANGVDPLNRGEVDLMGAIAAIVEPFRAFMSARVDPETLSVLQNLRPGQAQGAEPALSVLTPAFVLSEIARAFEIGFLIFLPFLIIDLVVAAVLMSMGMMMVPPAVVSLPFKLAFFVVADGWTLLFEALVRGYL